ncbi:MAG: hypothetical protein LBR77_02830 [Lachnospiraceae bacterium]|jgi:hypothetical protein|nr:hypothetical protein [Lachnospiraceae bacterium]
MNEKRPQDLQARLASLSLTTGLFAFCFGLFAGSLPDMQFGLGMAGVLLAWYSRKDHRFSGMAVVGLGLSVLAILSSFLATAALYFYYSMLQNPAYRDLIHQAQQQSLQLFPWLAR